MNPTRRSFIARAAATLRVPLWPRVNALSFQARDAGRIKARSFDLKQVRLRRGPFLDAAEINRKYSQALDVLKGMANWTRRWVDPLGETGHLSPEIIGDVAESRVAG